MTLVLDAPGRPTIHSDYTNEQARDILQTAPRRSEFAGSLLNNFNRLTPKQIYWLHKLAIDITTPPATVQLSGDFANIATLFDTARQHLRYPKITLRVSDALTIVLSVAGPNARVPGSINVASSRRYREGEYFGRIHRDGRFEPASNRPDVVEFLNRFASDPAGVAADIGRTTGCCVFCARALDDERSLAVGYGPI